MNISSKLCVSLHRELEINQRLNSISNRFIDNVDISKLLTKFKSNASSKTIS